MSETQQQFCLRWHNYQNSLLSSLPQLLDWDDLTDVTLYAGGCSIKAHRIVLSACSQYFKSIFKVGKFFIFSFFTFFTVFFLSTIFFFCLIAVLKCIFFLLKCVVFVFKIQTVKVLFWYKLFDST